MKVKLIVDGGKMQPGPAVSQQIGPMGINLGKVISDINELTKGFSGMKVPVEIDVNGKTKKYLINVFSPPVAELIKKEVAIEKGSGQPNNIKVGNIALERLIYIAKTKMPDFLAKDLKRAVKLVVGSCVSMGVLIDNKEPKEIMSDIDKGKYDKEIGEEITEISKDKKEKLEKFFSVRKAKQERDLKALEEAKAAAEAEAAKKAEAAGAGAALTATGVTAGAGTTTTGTGAKKEEAGAVKREETGAKKIEAGKKK